jgi:hypothetical protein
MTFPLPTKSGLQTPSTQQQHPPAVRWLPREGGGGQGGPMHLGLWLHVISTLVAAIV